MRSMLLPLLAVASLAHAASNGDVTAVNVPADATAARGAQLLSRIQAAAQNLNYSGTFFYQEGSQIHSSRITHLVDSSGEHEKLEILDGKVREFIRHDEQVRCYIPDQKLILSESNAKKDNFPALLASPAPHIDANYKVSEGGMERVAGRNSNVINLDPRDNLRYGYRLWSDQETGLLLRAQTLNDRHEIIEQVAFTDISVGGAIERSRVRPTAASTDGWHTEKRETVPANLAQQGWMVDAKIPGFRKIMEVKRTFGDHREVGQIVLSDGLGVISVFIEPLGPDQAEGDTTRGPINVSSKRQGDHWLTVLGEAPVETIHEVAESVKFRSNK